MQQALHGGWQVLMDELDTERVTYCMAALGSARRATGGGRRVRDQAGAVQAAPVQQIFRNTRLLRIGAGSDEIMLSASRDT